MDAPVTGLISVKNVPKAMSFGMDCAQVRDVERKQGPMRTLIDFTVFRFEFRFFLLDFQFLLVL